MCIEATVPEDVWKVRCEERKDRWQTAIISVECKEIRKQFVHFDVDIAPLSKEDQASLLRILNGLKVRL